MTLVRGNREQQAWTQNNSGPPYNTGLSLNSQPTLWSLNGWPGEATCFFTVMEKRISPNSKMWVGTLAWVSRNTHAVLLLLRTLLERYLEVTRIREEGEGIKLEARAQFRVVTSPAFSLNANKQLPKGAL